MTTASTGRKLLSIFFIIAFTFVLASCSKPAQQELRVLAWIGYDEKDLIDLVETRTGIKVAVKTFIGGDQMFTLLNQDPDAYDVVVVDPEYAQKLIKSGSIQQLSESEFNFSDYFPSLRHFPLSYDDKGNLYTVLVRFGVNGLLYNTKHITEQEARSYKILWDEKLRGRVVVFDWYLPNMGVLSRVAGNSRTPYDISDPMFQEVKKSMVDLRPNVKAIQSSFSEMIAALANEDAWVQPTAGESLTAILKAMGKPIDWTIPMEGGVMWSESLAIPKGAKHRDLAIQFIKFMQTPEAQAALARRKAYVGSVPNSKAYTLLTNNEKDILKIHSEAEAEALISKLSIRVLPVQQSEAEWQSAWRSFKAGN